MITPDVEALRDDFGFPGMRILQFGFSSDTKNIDLPHNYHKNVVASTPAHTITIQRLVGLEVWPAKALRAMRNR